MRRNKFDLKLLNEFELCVCTMINEEAYENDDSNKGPAEDARKQVKKIKEQILNRMDSLRNKNKNKCDGCIRSGNFYNRIS